MRLADLGYDAFFEDGLSQSAWKEHSPARVIAEYKDTYRVRGAAGEYWAKITGKQMFEAVSRKDYPAVGDWVAIAVLDRDRAVIHGILPRRTILRKKSSHRQESGIIAANIDVAFVVESVDRDFNLNRFERYFVLIRDAKIEPSIILNKVDLLTDAELSEILGQIKGRFPGIAPIPTSAIAELGLEELKKAIAPARTHCFLGSSGVGKSTLINKLLGTDLIQTREINGRTARGKHTTTNRAIYCLENGGIVIDNPGMREVGLVDSSAGIEDVFDEITALSGACRYADCTHMHEPGCAVLGAVEAGGLDAGKYSNYVKLKKETEHYEMTEVERRQKDRQFGKTVRKALKEVYKNKPF